MNSDEEMENGKEEDTDDEMDVDLSLCKPCYSKEKPAIQPERPTEMAGFGSGFKVSDEFIKEGSDQPILDKLLDPNSPNSAFPNSSSEEILDFFKEAEECEDAFPPELGTNTKCLPLRKVNDTELKQLNDAVQNLCNGTSGKYVPTPSKKQILQDCLLGLRRFQNSCRWKSLHALKKNNGVLNPNNTPGNESDDNLSDSDFDDDPDKATDKDVGGMDTRLKPTYKYYTAPKADENTKRFLKEVAYTILKQVDELDEARMWIQTPGISKSFKNLQKKLSELDVVVVPTDKTNSFKVVKTKQYINWMGNQLRDDATVTTKAKLGKVHEEALTLLKESENFLSHNEYSYIHEMINSRSVPTPKLLIKDHKKNLPNGDPSVRLVVPGRNFCAGFPNVGYRGLKKLLEDLGVNYSRHTIIQASNVARKIDQMTIKRENHTIISIDAQKMYPSIQAGMIEIAVNCFLGKANRELTKRENDKVNKCLEFIKFGMGNTFLTFCDKYYEYNGNVAKEERCLTIGGFESASLADLVVAYLFESTEEMFKDCKIFGCYRDDEIAIFEKVMTPKELDTGSQPSRRPATRS